MPQSGPMTSAAAANACHRLTQPGGTDKQGSPILRWAMVEAIQHQPDGSPAPDSGQDSAVGSSAGL